MSARFQSFSLSSRPAGGLLLLLVVAALILLPLLLIAAILAIIFFAVRLILRAILSMLPIGSNPVPRPFSDDEGRRNVRVRQPGNVDAPSET